MSNRRQLRQAQKQAKKQKQPSEVDIQAMINFFNNGTYIQALSIAENLTQNFPKYGFGWKLMGSILKILNREKEALLAMKNAVKLMPNDAESNNTLGVVLYDLKRLKEAENFCKKAIKLNQNYTGAYNNLGNIMQEQDRLIEAKESYLVAIKLEPNFAEAYSNLGNVSSKLGNLEEAEIFYLKCISLKPDFTEAYDGMGSILKQLSRLSEAKSYYLKSIQLNPNNKGNYISLGNILENLGEFDEAESLYKNALKLDPKYVIAYNNLGNVLRDLQRHTEAEIAYLKAIELNSNYATAYYNLANLLEQMARFNEAETLYLKVIEFKPDFAAEVYDKLATTINTLGRVAEAESFHLKAIELEPDFKEAYNNLGNTLTDLGRNTEAEIYYNKAIDLDPNYAIAYNNLGNTVTNLGRLKEAVSFYKKAIELKPDFLKAYNNLLFNLNYNPTFNIQYYLKWANKFGNLVSLNVIEKFDQHETLKDGNKLRIGFVSGDFRSHPVGYILEVFLPYIKEIELIAYSASYKEDKLTAKIKPYFKKWVCIYDKSDEQAAKMIHNDNVNILIDLSGHSKHNRLAMFAYKPSATQASWLGYFASTGVSEIDYFIGDPYVMPENEEERFTEKLYRLPNSWLCFSKPENAPKIEALPLLKNGFITFGCFNNLNKVNDDVISLWSSILLKIPTSKLFLKAKQLNDKETLNVLFKKFESCNISRDRLIFEGQSPRMDYMASYNKIDIALDTFPYHGGATSAEALYMGVPILTLKGDSFLSRVGESIVKNIEMDEWIAKDKDEYVQKAIDFSSNIELLSNIKTNLRDIVLSSPLFDGKKFAKDFEEAMKSMWIHLNQLKSQVQEKS